MRPSLLPLPAAVLIMFLAGCTGTAAPAPATHPSTVAPAGGTDARADLASRATVALDKAFAALYTYTDDSGTRSIVATVGADGSWKVDIPGGAQSGTANITIAANSTGVYQCTLSSAALPVTPTCVRVAAAGKKVPKAYDPKVQRLFRQWLTVFTDRDSALSVAAVQPLSGAQGDCWSVDSMTAALAAPVDVGIYCYSADGVLTAARVDFGQLRLTNQVPGPATVPLPGAVLPGPALGVDLVTPSAPTP